MKKQLFDFLKKYPPSAYQVDRLLISSFVAINQLEVEHNLLLRQHVINSSDDDYDAFNQFNELLSELTFENLIELFEFVISPSEKVVNGAVYTPENIRTFIVEKTLQSYRQDVATIKAADIACGCGGFLLTLAKVLRRDTARTYENIYRENIFGIDIADYSIQRTRLLLTLYAVMDGEDIPEFEFNLYTGNSLTFNWRETCPSIRNNNGFGAIVGNPPYVCSRNMDSETLALVAHMEVAATGHPDLYIPFFQIGLEQLNPDGVLGYITVNSFIKSINGRALRNYFHQHDVHLTLINFGGEQIFRERNTYTCICFLEIGVGAVDYIRTVSDNLSRIDPLGLHRFEYNDLNHRDGWNLQNDQATVDFIELIEATGVPFKELYDTKNGIATLKNEIYKFRPSNSDEHYYYLNDNGRIFPIERGICKKIVNANKLKTTGDLERIAEQIIFPYSTDIKIIADAEMRTAYPNTYAYLETKRAILATRDKGRRLYETWYAYGRRQSMEIRAYKLFFPHICDRPTFVICEEQDLLFYNGIAIVSENLQELQVIKKVLESDMFFRYIRNSTKDYASGYISMSRNYLKNFGVYQFNEEQRRQLLETDDTEQFLEELYGIVNLA